MKDSDLRLRNHYAETASESEGMVVILRNSDNRYSEDQQNIIKR